MVKLGVNIDHVATSARQGEFDPDPHPGRPSLRTGRLQQHCRHLREDRRHIQDRDIVMLKKR